MLKAVKKSIKHLVFKFIKPDYVPASYSQAGEDRIVNFLFKSKGIQTIQYLEIGVDKPDYGSNTYFFYKENSKGTLVEPNIQMIDQIAEKRPNDRLIHAGVGFDSTQKMADFFLFEEAAHSTFDQQEAQMRIKEGSYKHLSTQKVKLIEINQLLEQEQKLPDFLSLDVEGLDFKIIESLDFNKYPIPVICIETCSYSEDHIKEKNNKILQLMQSKGYFVYADTYINNIFVYKDWFYQSN